MKTFKLLLFSIIVLSFAGCSKDLIELKFNMPALKVKYTLKAKPAAGVYQLDPMVFSFNMDSLASANGTNLSKLKSLKVKKITFMIESPDTANFDVLDSGVLNISVGSIGDPDYELKRIAKFNSVPKVVKQFDIIPDDVDLLTFAKKPKFTVSGSIFTNSPVMDDIVFWIIIVKELVYVAQVE